MPCSRCSARSCSRYPWCCGCGPGSAGSSEIRSSSATCRCWRSYWPARGSYPGPSPPGASRSRPMKEVPMDRAYDVPLLGITIPDGADPTEFGAKCAAEHTHHPEPRYLELHHIVPRAWQRFWQPNPSHYVEGVIHEPNSQGLWCTITISLCRTAHGNIHYWIERMVRAYG